MGSTPSANVNIEHTSLGNLVKPARFAFVHNVGAIQFFDMFCEPEASGVNGASYDLVWFKRSTVKT